VRKTLSIVLLLLAGCGGSPHAGKTRLVLSPTAGNIFIREFDEFVDGSLVVRADGKEERYPLFKEENRKAEDEILEVDGIRVLSLRRKVTGWDLKRRTPDNASTVPVPISLVGKTYVVKRSELGTVLEGAEGATADEIRANSLDQMESILNFPEYPVGVGDSWPLYDERIIAVFGGEGGRGLKIRAVRGTARLEGAVPGNPPVALVSVQAEVEGAFRSLLDVDVTMMYRATFRIDIDRQRLVGMEASAEGRIKGEVDRQGKTALYEGDFRYSARGSSRLR
jgi:hypothetical protein